MDGSEAASAGRSASSAYVLDNAGKEAGMRFDALSTMFDPGTIRHLEERGITAGWHCLEVGGGGGSIAAWMGNCVGPGGRVLATDLDPRYLQSLKLPNVEVRQHNVVNDPLPEASFDLIHARLVLVHLPTREKVLERLVAALKPGGWLVDEEFDSTLAPDPALAPGEDLSRTRIAMGRVMDDRGVDRNFGRRVFSLLRTCGLENVAAEGRAIMWYGGSPGSKLLRSNYEQLHSAMVEAGYLTEEEYEHDVARLNDPSFVMPSPLLWAAWGRRPH